MRTIEFNDLRGKVCVISGGVNHFTESIALGLASFGVKIAIIDKSQIKAKSLVDKIKREYKTMSEGFCADICNKEALFQVKTEITNNFGEIDFLINGDGTSGKQNKFGNNSSDFGGFKLKKKEYYSEYDDEIISFLFDPDCRGILIPTMVFSKEMAQNGKGVVLNITTHEYEKLRNIIPRSSRENILANNLTEWLAQNMSKSGIKVNSILPEFIVKSKKSRFRTLSSIPSDGFYNAPSVFGQYGKVNDLQGKVLYLLSDVSNFLAGLCIPIDNMFCQVDDIA